MSEQLPLVPVDPEEKLTDRQRRALAAVRERGPISSDDLGGVLHEHPGCQWCRSAGNEVGSALRRKGLVKMRRGQGWVAVGAKAKGRADFGEFPEGY